MNKLLYIEWVDSCASHGWTDELPSTSLIQTAGWLLRETADSMTISASVSDVGMFDSPITIPKFAMRLVEEMEWKSKPYKNESP